VGRVVAVTGKTAVITGANAGLGFETARALARDGYRVVMACRNADRARDARQRLLAEVAGCDLRVLPLDVSEPASVRAFAARFADEVGALDLLVNNAGVVAMPLSRNSAGHEMQMATNYLGAFALTGLLLPCFESGRPCRIVNVGSLAHRLGRLDFDDLNWERTPYREFQGYANSKLALLTFTRELDLRLARSHNNILALAAHPGFAATEIMYKNGSTLAPTSAIGRWLNDRLSPLIPKPADAARATVLAATAAGVQGGDYYGPGGPLEIAGRPAPARLNRRAAVPEYGARLWQLSESLTGVRYLS